MKNANLFAVLVAFVVGGLIGGIVAEGKKTAHSEPFDVPEANVMEIHVIASGDKPMIAETIRILDDSTPFYNDDRPVWTIRYSTEKGVVTKHGQSVTIR